MSLCTLIEDEKFASLVNYLYNSNLEGIVKDKTTDGSKKIVLFKSDIFKSPAFKKYEVLIKELLENKHYKCPSCGSICNWFNVTYRNWGNVGKEMDCLTCISLKNEAMIKLRELLQENKVDEALKLLYE